jgi:hypothetical protein
MTSRNFIDPRSPEGERLIAEDQQTTVSDPKNLRRVEKLLASLGIPADAFSVAILRADDGERTITWSVEAPAPRRAARRRAQAKS